MGVTRMVAMDAHRFAETAELDDDASLDFEEFLAMQPRQLRDMHSTSTIREWFDAADTDGSGRLSVNEVCALPTCVHLTVRSLRSNGSHTELCVDFCGLIRIV